MDEIVPSSHRRRRTITMSVAKVQSHLSAECFNKLYIDGKFVDPKGGEKFPSYYPADGSLLHEFPRGRADDVKAAVGAAEAAWEDGTWARMKAADRADAVAKMARAVGENVDMLAEIEAADVGKPYRQASMVLGGAAGEALYWCSMGKVLDDGQDVPVDSCGGEGGTPPDGFDVVYRRDPIGVVGLIGAWNYPLNILLRKVSPALIAGNCAVVKPSEIAGLSCMFLSKLADEAGIPPGVLNVVTGDRDAGIALVSHPSVRMISFTGSTATGSHIMRACAPKLAQCCLELGGKSAMVVCDDADLVKAADTVIKGFLTNGGQICTAHTRLLVHEKVRDELLAKVKASLAGIPYCEDPISEKDRGDRAWEAGTTDVIQPVVCKSQHEKILAFLDGARSDGIEFLCGGGVPPDAPKGGYFIQPTVLIDVPSDHDVWQKEIFGPVLSVRTFTKDEEAVREVNATPFGLAAAVMTSDPVRGRNVANGIRAGVVYATSTGDGLLAEFPAVSRGGYGVSGMGRELGIIGLHEYTELKSVNYTGFSFSDAAATTAKNRQRIE